MERLTECCHCDRTIQWWWWRTKYIEEYPYCSKCYEKYAIALVRCRICNDQLQGPNRESKPNVMQGGYSYCFECVKKKTGNTIMGNMFCTDRKNWYERMEG